MDPRAALQGLMYMMKPDIAPHQAMRAHGLPKRSTCRLCLVAIPTADSQKHRDSWKRLECGFLQTPLHLKSVGSGAL